MSMSNPLDDNSRGQFRLLIHQNTLRAVTVLLLVGVCRAGARTFL